MAGFASNADLLSLSDATRSKRIGIITADWNSSVTHALEDGCIQALKAHQIPDPHILCKRVPGAFELPLGAQNLAEMGSVQAVVCIGCLIKGETPHFHYIADAVTHKIIDLNLHYGFPFIYSILTVDNEEQARERAGGREGNKGEEAGRAALHMLEFRQSLRKGKQAGFG